MKVEYLYEHVATDVKRKAGGGYVIEFESGARLIHELGDPPEHIKGKVFALAAFHPNKIVMHFRQSGKTDTADWTVELSPLHTGVAMGSKEEVHWPFKTPAEEIELPPDPSPERVAEGPETPENGNA